jgi:hypothetical protein
MTSKLDGARAAYAPTLRVVKRDAGEATRAAVKRAIAEVLDTVAIVPVRERLMNKAFERAGLAGPPVSRLALRYFLEGPLYETIVEILGGDAAEAVLRALREIADRAGTSPMPTSGVRTLPGTEPPRAALLKTATTKLAIVREGHAQRSAFKTD